MEQTYYGCEQLYGSPKCGSNVVNFQYAYAYCNNLQYIDLSNNNISDISPISAAYDLETLNLSNNTITSFTDSMSGLESLKELGVGNCGIEFSDIRSLRFVNNLVSLDISGTDPDLTNVGGLSNLKKLYMQNCKLDEKSLTPLNNLTNLEVLDVSQNNITKESYNNSLDPTKLHLIELAIGGSAFTELPDLSAFTNLKTLDLTNSYNITSFDCVEGLNVETLILDNCNRLDVSDSDEYQRIIDSLANLKRLSIVGGFNYLTHDIYEIIKSKVAAGMSLRLDEEKWITKDTITNYNSAIYFSLAEFINAFKDPEISGVANLKAVGGSEHIILILINDVDAPSTSCKINVDKSVFKFEVYGRQNVSYDLSFNVGERKQSTMEFEFHDVSIKTSNCAITAALDSKIVITAVGVVKIDSSATESALKVFDFKAVTKFADSTLLLKSSNVGANGNDSHYAGFKGADCLYCYSYKLNGNITIVGGEGGNGRGGRNSGAFEGGGGNGGAGGDGGHAINCVSGARNSSLGNVTLIGGEGGEGGAGGSGGWFSGSGRNGAAGAKGELVHQRTEY